ARPRPRPTRAADDRAGQGAALRPPQGGAARGRRRPRLRPGGGGAGVDRGRREGGRPPDARAARGPDPRGGRADGRRPGPGRGGDRRPVLGRGVLTPWPAMPDEDELTTAWNRGLPVMSENRTCPRCGRELPEDAPRGLCPACLLAAALAGPGETADETPGPDDQVPIETGDTAADPRHAEGRSAATGETVGPDSRDAER